MQTAIRAVTDHHDLSEQDMADIMRLMMTGQATPAQIGGFLIGLRMKGETVAEITAAARVMRDLATHVDVRGPHLVDTCGTGGDSAATFNISTASAFVVAAAGGKVAKHGNRSVSSKSGSADVLEAAGVNLSLNPQQVARCINEVGVGFMFAPLHHSAMKHAIGPRREMGARTLFNLLGPLTNPAGAPNQVMGVFSKRWVEPLAHVLRNLGSSHVMIVHAEDGMDEISIGSITYAAELRDGKISSYTISPEQFGISRSDVSSLTVENAQQSLEIIHGIFQGNAGPAQDIVVLNAGAAIYVAGLSDTLASGVDKALQMIANGSAGKKLEELVQFTKKLQKESSN